MALVARECALAPTVVGDRFVLKASHRMSSEDLRSLQRFREDDPEAKACLLHAGTRREHSSCIDLVPFTTFAAEPENWL